MSVIRECILNEVKMGLVRVDHEGYPKEVNPQEDPRKTLLDMAVIAIHAIEEMDIKTLGDAV